MNISQRSAIATHRKQGVGLQINLPGGFDSKVPFNLHGVVRRGCTALDTRCGHHCLQIQALHEEFVPDAPVVIILVDDCSSNAADALRTVTG